MTAGPIDYRLDGVYPQRQEGFRMQRVKLPAGVISASQASAVAAAAADHGRGIVHLTTRCSMELHWLTEADLPAVKRALTAVGLTSRGACGGAVRGISCGSSAAGAWFMSIEELARRLQHHFAGNPRFERLPKKFKIGIQEGTSSKRHLIQDAGIVLRPHESGELAYDLYVGGGLGRAPRPGILLASGLAEGRLIPLIEAVIRVYAAGAVPGKRLKHLLEAIGEQEFRARLAADPGADELLPQATGLPQALTPPGKLPTITIPLFAGQITSQKLENLARFAAVWGGGYLTATPDQDLLVRVPAGLDAGQARAALAEVGFVPQGGSDQVCLRVCPGSHECRVGLAPTREIAQAIRPLVGPQGSGLTWAISGCPNSCSQPQLADFGIVACRLTADDDGRRSPRFDLYRSAGEGLAERVGQSVPLAEVLDAVRRIG